MKQTKYIALTVLSASLLISNSLFSETQKTQSVTLKSVTLKVIMQQLLLDTQSITEGMMTENFKMIEKAADSIASHPEIPLATKMKIMKAFGPEMPMFKANDMKVHQAAVEIKKAAQQKDLKAIVPQFHQLIDGCDTCHSIFKKRVQKILKES